MSFASVLLDPAEKLTPSRKRPVRLGVSVVLIVSVMSLATSAFALFEVREARAQLASVTGARSDADDLERQLSDVDYRVVQLEDGVSELETDVSDVASGVDDVAASVSGLEGDLSKVTSVITEVIDNTPPDLTRRVEALEVCMNAFFNTFITCQAEFGNLLP